ncbi:hypothetical protein D6810_02485, partial [Candidatus Dojkabacteria bacterium]
MYRKFLNTIACICAFFVLHLFFSGKVFASPIFEKQTIRTYLLEDEALYVEEKRFIEVKNADWKVSNGSTDSFVIVNFDNGANKENIQKLLESIMLYSQDARISKISHSKEGLITIDIEILRDITKEKPLEINLV